MYRIFQLMVVVVLWEHSMVAAQQQKGKDLTIEISKFIVDMISRMEIGKFRSDVFVFRMIYMFYCIANANDARPMNVIWQSDI